MLFIVKHPLGELFEGQSPGKGIKEWTGYFRMGVKEIKHSFCRKDICLC